MIYRTIMAIADTDGSVYKMDTIKHGGHLWLVPMWLSGPRAGWRRPERIVRLGTPALPVTPAPSTMADWVATSPIPKSVLSGPGPWAEGFVVRLNPPVQFPIPRGIH